VVVRAGLTVELVLAARGQHQPQTGLSRRTAAMVVTMARMTQRFLRLAEQRQVETRTHQAVQVLPYLSAMMGAMVVHHRTAELVARVAPSWVLVLDWQERPQAAVVVVVQRERKMAVLGRQGE